MFKLVQNYISNVEGATAVEYGLIGAGIAVAVSVTVFLIGGDINGFFDQIRSFL